MSFHPGIAPRLTKKERILAEKKKRELLRKQKYKKNKITPFNLVKDPYFFKKPIFNILPEKTFHPRVSSALLFTYSNPKSLYNLIERWQDPPFNIPPQLWKNGFDDFWSPELRDAIEDAVFKVQGARFLFRKLLHHWRFRHLKKANTEDIVTMELPKKKVYLVDWNLRTMWIFEASSLMKDITMRLYNHDGFFEDPQKPRNPYTNHPLTPAQTVSIWNQLSICGIPVSVPFTSYRSSRYNIKRFCGEQSVCLQLHALRTTMRNLDVYDTYERMIDFINYSYNQESVDCYIQAYAHAIKKYPDNILVKSWQRLCTKFYEADIIFNNDLDKKIDIQNRVLDETIKLLDKQKILVSLRNEDLRNSVNVRGDTPFPLPPIRLGAFREIPFSLLTHIVSELEISFNL